MARGPPSRAKSTLYLIDSSSEPRFLKESTIEECRKGCIEFMWATKKTFLLSIGLVVQYIGILIMVYYKSPYSCLVLSPIYPKQLGFLFTAHVEEYTLDNSQIAPQISWLNCSLESIEGLTWSTPPKKEQQEHHIPKTMPFFKRKGSSSNHLVFRYELLKFQREHGVFPRTFSPSLPRIL